MNRAATAMVGALLVGLGLAATPTIITSYARDRCIALEYPTEFSYVTAALGIGQLIGPIAGGPLADRFGMVAIPLFAASAYGLGAVFVAWATKVGGIHVERDIALPAPSTVTVKPFSPRFE